MTDDFECPICFFIFEKETTSNVLHTYKLNSCKCDYCSEQEKTSPMSLEKRVQRILSIMSKTHCHRLPEMLRLIHEDAKYGKKK